jgi:hypothetical protein
VAEGRVDLRGVQFEPCCEEPGICVGIRHGPRGTLW